MLFTEYSLECQDQGLFNTLPTEMIDSVIRVASKFNRVQVVADQMKLRAQREFKLRDRDEAK